MYTRMHQRMRMRSSTAINRACRLQRKWVWPRSGHTHLWYLCTAWI